MADLPSVSESIPPSLSSSSQPQQPTRRHLSGRFLTTRTHGESSRSSSISFASPALANSSEMRSDSRGIVDLTESRRRVRSLGHHPAPYTTGTLKSTSLRHHGPRRKKNLSQSHNNALSPSKLDPFVSDFEPSAFSDEYDLSHEDPKILQDVQRALQLQSRRRDRMSQQLYPVSDEVLPSTDASVNASTSLHASTFASPPPVQSSPQYLQAVSLPSEVDFSPSTRSVPLHPVPLSSNGGATLDWTGSQSEDEKLDRRWSISRTKRKSRDRLLSSNKAVVEKQEALFTDKISRIRAEASPPTVRKAAIVSEQIGRRYNVLYNSIASGDPVNIAQVVRWYADSGTETRAWLDSAEPLTWLKHLLNHRGKRRSEWHISALIVEEHVKSKKGIASSTPPPQSPVATSSLETPPSQIQPIARQPHAPPSDSSLGTTLSRVRSSDGHLSFGPVVETPRDSINNSQTRIEAKARGWRHSIPAFFDSASANGTPSPYHTRNSPGGLSPASSRLNFPDIIHRFRRHPTESEEASSSPLNSQSEDQNDLPSTGRRRRKKWKDQPRLSELPSPQESGTELDIPSEMPHLHDLTPLPIGSASSPTFPAIPDPELEVVLDSEVNQPDTIMAPQPTPSIHPNRSYRSSSLPISSSTVDPISWESKSDPEEDQLEREYELKQGALDELKNHNHRLRHRMQRVATDVREYDIICSTVMPAFGLTYHSLPTEVLDALNHDPSAVTSGTRRRHGWRVVEDIQARVLRQREIIESFLSMAKADTKTVHVPDELLDKPISILMEKLQALEKERGPLQEQTDEVSAMLDEVRASHAVVKAEYNNAVSYTSVVYPELSHIVAMEERYKDPYLQVWELGMDALTFILDTVTPFWRNYGKTIGEDIQDFMIIPWYRNEFTGETKRYPVESVPLRSRRHWVALFCLGGCTFIVTLFQARTAILSAWHYRLLWIENQGFRWAIMPFFWVAILIQWIAVMFEVCVVLLQLAVVAWWLGWFIGICT